MVLVPVSLVMKLKHRQSVVPSVCVRQSVAPPVCVRQSVVTALCARLGRSELQSLSNDVYVALGQS